MESNKQLIEKIAVIMTVFNRKEKTLRCLNSLCRSWAEAKSPIQYEVFLTNDGCTDGTKEAVMALDYQFPIHIIEGTGNLFWLGGMNLAWRAAINQSGFDGYLWLNDDTIVLADFWIELLATQQYAQSHYGIGGIYVGSTCDPSTKQFTYGGFDFINKWTLKDRFIIPNGQDIKPCECAHGNITYVSNEVVRRLGVFHDGYIHGAGDHDYTYQAHRKGLPVLVMKNYAGLCENDHIGKGKRMEDMTLKERLRYCKSPFGLNIHNTLLFQKRNFWYRYPFVWLMCYCKVLFPRFFMWVYRVIRK